MRRFKTQVIVNPESAKGETRKRWSQIRDGLRHFIHDFKFEFTERPSHAIEIARASLKNGTDLIIGVGGDGTLNEIANGFYESSRPINPEAALGRVATSPGVFEFRLSWVERWPSFRMPRQAPWTSGKCPSNRRTER
jgi:diacylglycerol kinase (ATP)